MASVSASQLPGLVTNAGYQVMADTYTAQPAVRQSLFETLPCTGSEFGWTEKAMIGDSVPTEIGYSEPAPARTLDEGFQWLIRMRKLAESISISEEVMKSPNASAIITQRVMSAAGKFGEGFQVAKETLAASIFNKGAFTAGDVATFRGSFEGHVDPYPAFIYDGKPFLAAAGNGHPLALNSAVTKYNKVATALSSTNLIAARILLEDTNAVDEAGNKIYIKGDTLVVPPALTDTALILANSELVPGTAQNDTNTLKGAFNVVTWRYLTTATSWALMAARKGIRCYDSGIPMIFVSAPDEATGDVTIRFISYFGMGVTDWRYVVGSNFPAS